MSDKQELQALLDKTSRTFALSIPLLPEPTRTQVSIAYLVFRIVDTLEDATEWGPEQRIEALEEVQRLLSLPNPRLAAACAERWLAVPPVRHAGYLQLLQATARVFDELEALPRAAREQITHSAGRSAQGMIGFIRRADERSCLQLASLVDLRSYCYVVAGLVGEMLTELFVLGRPELAGVAPELRRRAVAFGEGLQLVNILKDVNSDAEDGRVYLPLGVPPSEVFALARADLAAAAEYNDLLRSVGTDRGLWAFNALNARLAAASLKLLQTRGLGSKLTRPEVSTLRAQILHAADAEAPLAEASGT